MPLVVEPLALGEPVVGGFNGVFLEIFEVEVGGVDAAPEVLFGKNIQSVPAVGGMLRSSAVDHGNELGQAEKIAVQHDNGAPEVRGHGLGARALGPG